MVKDPVTSTLDFNANDPGPRISPVLNLIAATILVQSRGWEVMLVVSPKNVPLS